MRVQEAVKDSPMTCRDEAEHVGVTVEEDVHWSLGMKTDVCDGNCPFGAKE